MRNSLKLLTSYVFILLCTISILGCHPAYQDIGAYDKDVTKHEKLWGGYKYQQEYTLLMDVFLRADSNESNPMLLLTPPGGDRYLGLWSGPYSVQDYEENKELWERSRIIGIVSSGTKIKCVELREHGALLWGSSLDIYAEILDGPYKDKVVNIHDISKIVDYDKSPMTFKPDIRILRELEIDPIAVK